jgi:hypothetical protein
MNDKPQNEKKIEETLNSLDHMHRASPGSFFFNRLQARLKEGTLSRWKKLEFFLARPAIAMAAAFLIIALNVILILRNSEPAPPSVDQEEQALADEYGLTVNAIYNYENGLTNE